MNKMLLEAGKIVNTHGLRGEIRIFPMCDSADFLTDLPRFFIDGAPVSIMDSRVHKGQLLCRLDGIDTIEKAQSLIGKIIFISRSDVVLEEGRFFIEDIKGLKVIDRDTGKLYGEITEVIQTGANDVFEVKSENETYLIPKIDDVVKEIDPEKGVVYILPIKGLFDK